MRTLDHHPVHPEGMRQQVAGSRDVAAFEAPADGGGRDHLRRHGHRPGGGCGNGLRTRRRRLPGQALDLETEFGPEPAQECDIPGRLEAEPEVVADHDRHRVERSGDLPDELLGRLPGPASVEVDHERRIGAVGVEQLEPTVECRQQRWHLVGSDHGRGMRVERHDDRSGTA